MHADEPVSHDTYAPLLTAAAGVLAQTLGHAVQLSQVTRLTQPGRRNVLLRCQVLSGSGPLSLIIKKVESQVEHPDQSDMWDVQRFWSDWAGAQFLSTLPGHSPHGPRFYGGDRAEGFILLEDLGPHSSLVEPLLNEEPVHATRALLLYATRLGAMHADTIGQAARFTRLWRTLTPHAVTLAHEVESLLDQVLQLRMHLEALGVRIQVAFAEEVASLLAAMTTPGPFWAYIHGDPCPDNVLYTAEQARLIDFEFGQFGHALRDGTYARMCFPTCWCANRLPEALVLQVEAAYRATLVPGCPAAEDDRLFHDALVQACGYWMLRTLVQHLPSALDEDRPWGIATIRPRLVSRLEAFITTAEAYHRLPAVQATVHRVLKVIRQRWPETPPLPVYPAFRQDTSQATSAGLVC